MFGGYLLFFATVQFFKLWPCQNWMNEVVPLLVSKRCIYIYIYIYIYVHIIVNNEPSSCQMQLVKCWDGRFQSGFGRIWLE